MDLNRTISWINKTEGRDKFCKIIQYGSRFLKYNLTDKQLAARFSGLFVGMRDARKLFRLFKSINEAHKILEILNKGSTDEIDVALNILNRLAFLLYWVFDNIAILGTIKFLTTDSKKFTKYGSFFWFWALIFSLVQSVRKLNDLNKKERNDRRADPENQEATQKKLAKTASEKKDQYLNIIKNLGDLITASQGSDIFPKLTGKTFTDGWIGAGGFVSAVITSYQLY